MSREEQARRLLRAIGDIDDRFLLDAMAEAPAGQRTKERKKPARYGTVLRWVAAAAACLVIAFAGKTLLTPFTPFGNVSTSSGETTEETTEETADAASGNTADAGSPFVEVETMEEAAAITGFGLEAPEMETSAESAQEDDAADAQTVTGRVISVLDGTMIEVSYQNSSGEEVWCVRKAEGAEDISGDYEEYAAVETVAVGEREVTLKGDGETVSAALWQKDGYTYALCAENSPMTEEDIINLVSEIDP